MMLRVIDETDQDNGPFAKNFGADKKRVLNDFKKEQLIPRYFQSRQPTNF